MRFRKPLIVGQFGYDAYAYWSVDLRDLYGSGAGSLSTVGAFRYAPAVAQVFAFFGLLPWTAFVVLWSALLVGTLAWLGGRWTVALLALPPVALELYAGNVNLLIAAALALGFRHPWIWAFPLLTKVTPGVGLVWFAVRREWRSLGIALAVTLGLVLASFAVAPELWFAWIVALQNNLAAPTPWSLPIPLALRLPAAVVLVAWGARTDRPWTVPVAAAVATPVLWIFWPAWMTVALGALPLSRTSTLGGQQEAGAPAEAPVMPPDAPAMRRSV